MLRVLTFFCAAALVGCGGTITFGDELEPDAGSRDAAVRDAGDTGVPPPVVMTPQDCSEPGSYPMEPPWPPTKENYVRIFYTFATGPNQACTGCHGATRPFIPATAAALDDPQVLARAISEFYTSVRPGNNTAPIATDHAAGGASFVPLPQAGFLEAQQKAGCAQP